MLNFDKTYTGLNVVSHSMWLIPLGGALFQSIGDFAVGTYDHFADLNAEFASTETTSERKEELGSWLSYAMEGMTPRSADYAIANMNENPVEKLVRMFAYGVGVTGVAVAASRSK